LTAHDSIILYNLLSKDWEQQSIEPAISVTSGLFCRRLI